MNPLGFLAASWPLLLPLDYGLQRWLGWDNRTNVSFFIEAARLLRPYLMVIPVGFAMHMIFRVVGSRRRWTTTMGLLLYWMVLFAAVWVLGLLACRAFRVGNWLPKMICMLTLAWGALALAGAHRTRWWWTLLALVGVTAISIFSVNKLLDSLRLT